MHASPIKIAAIEAEFSAFKFGKLTHLFFGEVFFYLGIQQFRGPNIASRKKDA